MGAECKRRSLADTLRATSPIAGAALASTASAIRLISAPQEATPEVTAGSQVLPERPLRKSKPLSQPVIKPLSQPLSRSQDHSASHSASLSLSQSQDQSLSQTCLADSLSQNQKAILSHLIETRPYIISFAKLGGAVGVVEASTRTALRRLATLGFIDFKRARDGQIQGVSISFNESLCRQFTQGHSLDHSLGQPVTKPLSSKKIDLREEIYPSDAVAEKLAKLTDEQIASNWPELAAKGLCALELRRVLRNLSALNISAAHLVEGLCHGNYELYVREGQAPRLDAKGKPVDDLYRYIFQSLFKTGYFGRPQGYVSTAEQKEKDAEQEALQVVEAHKKREEAEFQAWCCCLTQEEREAMLHNGPPAPDHIKLNSAWRKSREKARRTEIDGGNSPQAKPQEA